MRQASSLFASRGYDAVSVREIVEAAGVTKPSLYYYFNSKEGLARALIDELHAAGADMRREVFRTAKDVRDLLEVYTREMLALAQRYRDTFAFAFSLWFGRSSLKDLNCQTEKHHEGIIREWHTALAARGMSERAAEVTVKAYWALLMQELLKVVHCPEFTGCAYSLADEMATLVIHGAQAFDEGRE